MTIGILSFQSRDPEPALEDLKLLKAAQDLGHEVVLIATKDCLVSYPGESVFWKGSPFPDLDLLIPRARTIDHNELQVHLLEVLERRRGTLNLNSAFAIVQAKNKVKTLQILSQIHLPVPRSVIVEDASFLNAAIHQVSGFPVVLKTPYGTYGQGVCLATSLREAEAILDHLWTTTSYPRFLVQEFIREAHGSDVRVFVVGKRVVASMRRQARPGEFRSNVECGGGALPFISTEKISTLAVNAVAALGLDYAGVDILESHRGPLIIEVNANPGFKTLEQVTEVNVAAEILNHGIEMFHQRRITMASIRP